jgi:predicted secreted protein
MLDKYINHMAIYIYIYDMFLFVIFFGVQGLDDSFSEGMGTLTVAMQTFKMFAPSLAPVQPD